MHPGSRIRWGTPGRDLSGEDAPTARSADRSVGPVTDPPEPTAAELLRALLELVEAGELDANSPEAMRMVTRLQGAIAALEALTS
jgi:hypothetical protein